MAKNNANSFEARERKNKKRSSIVKMSELRAESFEIAVNEPKEEQKAKGIEAATKVETVKPTIVEEVKVQTEVEPKKAVNLTEMKFETPNAEEPKVVSEGKTKDVKSLTIEEVEERKQEKDKSLDAAHLTIEAVSNNDYKNQLEIAINAENDFFNLNVKNDVFEGKMTTVRVYDDILDILKSYASMKNYPIIEFTNKVITLGLDDFATFGVLEISEIKLKNNTSRSIMYNLTDIMEVKLNKYIDELNGKGYKVSRNVILNVILNETLKKFYI